MSRSTGACALDSSLVRRRIVVTPPVRVGCGKALRSCGVSGVTSALADTRSAAASVRKLRDRMRSSRANLAATVRFIQLGTYYS